ncbi:MAG: proteic killer suppression protein [Gammaproteobacteria bacterium]|jgi:proteic killer suppression protein
MITSFGDRRTEDLFHGRATTRIRRILPNITSVAQRKLDMPNAAADISDLTSPPNNRLEALRGNLKGFYSLRINDQWRVIFRWSEGDASALQLIDYH